MNSGEPLLERGDSPCRTVVSTRCQRTTGRGVGFVVLRNGEGSRFGRDLSPSVLFFRRQLQQLVLHVLEREPAGGSLFGRLDLPRQVGGRLPPLRGVGAP